MELKCPFFENGGFIPTKYSCEGEDVSPPLEISGIPDGTKSLVLIVDDPDAPVGTFVHWLVWDIKPENKIDENSVPPGSFQGKNDFGRNDYGGPCPPSGTHRYYFKLYALDRFLNLAEGSSKEDLEEAIEGCVIESSVLVGRFSR